MTRPRVQALWLFWLLAVPPWLTLAATITVTSTADESALAPDNGNCTLREAIEAARSRSAVDACDAGTGSDLVALPAGTYSLTLLPAGGFENNPHEGDLDLEGDIVIAGAGAAQTFIDGSQIADRVFDLHPWSQWAQFEIRDLTIQGGSGASNGGGGAVHSAGNLTLRRVHLRNNSAGGFGGNNNWAAGGAVFVGSGGVTIVDSTLSDNSAGLGGAIANLASVTLSNVTFSGNREVGILGQGGGAVLNSASGTVSMINVTFFGNSAPVGGGSAIQNEGEVVMRNALFGAGAECAGSGTYVSQGFNLDEGTGCSFSEPGDRTGVALALSQLEDNGGPTPTHALGTGSAAIDVADTASCPAADQRGVARPQDGDGDGVARCDAGAYEAPAVAPVAADLGITVSASPNPSVAGQRTTITATVTNLGPATAHDVSVTLALDGAVLGVVHADQGRCASAADCNLGALDAGGSLTVSAEVDAAAGDHLVTAAVSSSSPDHHAGNDTASVIVTATAPAGAPAPNGGGAGGGGGCTTGGGGGALMLLLAAAALRPRAETTRVARRSGSAASRFVPQKPLWSRVLHTGRRDR